MKKESSTKYTSITKVKSKNGQAKVKFEQYVCNVNNALNWITMHGKIEVKNMPELRLAYISHQGDMAKIGEVYQKLMQWAYPKGLMQQEDLRMVTIYHDSPKITSINKLRMSACMTLDRMIRTDGEVNIRIQPKTKCIVARFELAINEFAQAWENSFVWMNENGYSKSEQDPFGIYYNDPKEHPEGKCIVDICIPVV